MTAPAQTKVVIDSLRGLDALVAQCVFNCQVRIHQHPDETFYHCECEGNPHGRKRYFSTEVPEYSTDIAAAWQVVEKIRASDDADRMADQLQAIATQDGYPSEFAYWLVLDCEDPASVICLAALRAKGVEVELRIET